MQLISAQPRALKMNIVEIEQRFPFHLGFLPTQHRPDVDPIDRVARRRPAAQTRDRWEDIHGGADSVTDAPLRNPAGEARDEWFPHAALIGHAFASTQPARASLIPG